MTAKKSKEAEATTDDGADRADKARARLASTGRNAGKLTLEFENFIASVPFTVK